MSFVPRDAEVEEQLRTGSNEIELRRRFGDALYEELATLARNTPVRRPDVRESARSKVFILPGIMGSSLSRPGALFLDDLIWLDLDDLALGGVAKLEYGQQPDRVFASGVMQSAYLRMKLRLNYYGLDADFLPYDWRHSPSDIAAKLHAQLAERDINGATLVCHSMGGLVARGMAASDSGRKVISRIITIGTPNHGSYSPVQVFRLTHSLLQMLGKLDLHHTPSDIANKYLRHFPGLVEMLPSPDKRSGENYFAADGWPSGGARPTLRVLAAALDAKSNLAGVDDRFTQIIGIGEETIQRARIVDNELAYELDKDGDGTVPRDLAVMGNVPRYYARGEHGSLCNLLAVIKGVRDILKSGDTSELEKNPPIAVESVRDGTTITDSAARRVLAERANALDDRPDIEDLLRGIASRDFDPDPEIVPADADGSDVSPGAPGFAASAEPRALPAPGTKDAERHESELDAIRRASEAWRNTTYSRQSAQERARSAGPLEAEEPARVSAYVRRLVGQLKQVPDLSEMSGALREMVRSVDPTAEREPLEVRPRVAIERVIGEAEEFLSVYFIKRAQKVLSAVGRIIDDRGDGFGTGFLVAPDVLITNQHVLRNFAEAQESSVEFHYEFDIYYRSMPTHVFKLRPDLFFLNSAEHDATSEPLDFALVAVETTNNQGVELAGFGHLPLVGVEGKIRVGQPVNIIQHPAGGRKQVVFRESELLPLPERPNTVAHYTGDTKRGSSGSPVFSDKWEVVALHNAGVPEVDDDGNWLDVNGNIWREDRDPNWTTIKWVANQGIRMSRLVRKLKQELQDIPASAAGRSYLAKVIEVGDIAAEKGVFYAPEEARTSSTRPTGGHPMPSRKPVEIRPGIVRPPGAPLAQVTGQSITVPLSITISLGDTAQGLGTTSVSIAPPDQAGNLTERRRASDYADRKGYDPGFLCRPIAMPRPQNTVADDVVAVAGSGETELRYDHFSVLMSKSRRLAFVSAGNVRTDAPAKGDRRDNFISDPRLTNEQQADNRFYKHNVLDRGHLFRRDDGSWGDTAPEAQRADDDTFHWTNIAPQHEVFNQSSQDPNRSLWGLLENHVTREAHDERAPFSVFNGPVFQPGDPVHRGLQIPQAFYKIVAICDRHQNLRAFAFIVGQAALLRNVPVERLSSAERFDEGRFSVFQVKVRDIEFRTGLDFDVLRQADVLERAGAQERFERHASAVRLATLDDIVV